MPSAHIKIGVWELLGENFDKRWILTLENTQAFWLLGIFAVLLMVVQKSAWVGLRYLIYIWKPPIRLDNEENPLLALSQTDAIVAMGYTLKIKTWRGFRLAHNIFWAIFDSKQNSRYRADDEVVDGGAVSAWFGVFAVINGTFFILTGILLPLWVTNGVENSIVRSKKTSYCDFRLWQPIGGGESEKKIYSFAEAKYDQCWDKPHGRLIKDSECSSAPKTLNITDLPDVCPWHSKFCINDTETRVIRQTDISYREMGLNSKSRVFLNHQLVCAPFNLEEWFVLHEGNPVLEMPSEGIVSLPNLEDQYTTINSRIDAAPVSSIFMLLGSGDIGGVVAGSFISLPEALSADDTIFLIVYRVRPDRPLTTTSSFKGHPSDFGTTGIGCFERFQHCYSIKGKQNCLHAMDYGSGARENFANELDRLGLSAEEVSDFKEIGKILADITEISQFLYYFQVTTMNYLQHFETYGDPRLIWKENAISWYLKTWWYSRAKIQSIVSTLDSDYYITYEDEYGERWNWCSRILLENGDYTNINFFRLLASLGAISLIYLATFPRIGFLVFQYIRGRCSHIHLYFHFSAVRRFARSIQANFASWLNLVHRSSENATTGERSSGLELD